MPTKSPCVPYLYLTMNGFVLLVDVEQYEETCGACLNRRDISGVETDALLERNLLHERQAQQA